VWPHLKDKVLKFLPNDSDPFGVDLGVSIL
jgi:hypothetical protein